MREIEYTLSYDGISRCRDSNASLAMRERVFLYSVVYSLAPKWVLEIGCYKGGSAYIISGALDDLALGGKLVSIDPYPEQIEIDWNIIAHNSKSVKGLFPQDIKLIEDNKFDFVFLDGNHSYDGVLSDLSFLPQVMNNYSYVLLHDAYNADVDSAIKEAIAKYGYIDCGRIGRVKNDLSANELYGGLHLLLRK